MVEEIRDGILSGRPRSTSERARPPSSTTFEVHGHECHVLPLSLKPDSEHQASLQTASHPDGGVLAGTFVIDEQPYAVIATPKGATSDDSLPQVEPARALTRRELQVAILVARGKVNKQIAAELNISEWTVSTHIRRIFAKLNVRSRAAMTAYIANHF